MHPSPTEVVGAVLFAIALIHTFSTKFFEHLAHSRPRHAGIWHLLGEVEVVFGFWAMILVMAMLLLQGKASAIAYIESRNFTEPLFVFSIMVIAGTRPVLQFAGLCVKGLARAIPLPANMAHYFIVLAFVPVLGSFITEPAAMTLAALILRDRYLGAGVPVRFKYATLGVLFVNISIGGTLTPFAAPPVLMVAAKWDWDVWHMISVFGWKAVVAVVINAATVALLLRKELAKLSVPQSRESAITVPAGLIAVHLLFMVGVVVFAHHSAIFMGLFLFFLGVASAYERHQDKLILREGLLVAFFLAGLVVLGGQQQWWLQPALLALNDDAAFYGAIALTAITDNAALTYLGSLVDGLSDSFKYALVAGAVTGGGLTIIANAPNPAGVAILRDKFDDGTVHPLGLLTAALVPTAIAMLAFRVL